MMDVCKCGGKLIPQYHTEYNPKKSKYETWLSHLTCDTCFKNIPIEQRMVSER